MTSYMCKVIPCELGNIVHICVIAKSYHLETSLNPMSSHMEITNHIEGHKGYPINMFMSMCYFPGVYFIKVLKRLAPEIDCNEIFFEIIFL